MSRKVTIDDLPFSKKKSLKLVGQKPTKKDLDDLCREIIFMRDKNTCQVCGKKTDKLDWMHFLTRGNFAVRWDLDNSCVGCAGCHTMSNKSAHKDPLSFADFVKKRLGETKYNELRLRATAVKGIDRWAVKLYLLAEKKKLKGGEANGI